jgi:hypothetical protein
MQELENAIINGTHATRNVESTQSYFEHREVKNNIELMNVKSFNSTNFVYTIDLKTLEDEHITVKQNTHVCIFKITHHELQKYVNDEEFTTDDKNLRLNNVIQYLTTKPIVFKTKNPIVYRGSNIPNMENKLTVSCKELILIQGQEQINQIFDYIKRGNELNIYIPITILSTNSNNIIKDKYNP